MATYIRTVVMTMRNLGIQLAVPYPAPTATRTRRHQYIQYRFYNPLRDRIEVVPTTRAGINRWIRRQRKFAAANSPISMQHAVPMEQDDALNLAYAIATTTATTTTTTDPEPEPGPEPESQVDPIHSPSPSTTEQINHERDCEIRLWFEPIPSDFRNKNEYGKWKHGAQGTFYFEWVNRRLLPDPYPQVEMIQRSGLKRKHNRDDKARISQEDWDVCMDLMQHFPLDTDGAVRLTALKSLEDISIFGSRLPVAFELLNVTVVSHAPPANLSRMVTRESDYLHFDCNFATYHLGKHEYKNPFVRDMAIDNACRFSSILDVYRANIK